ncbi:TetR/AcrR family transcriptional regulator [Sinomonas susongensis]|uniref:TetR/AcrR family transcriptional regulator n=1 Tax=Sinomonas susongensis TaxID=1324851 RepID=UPI001109B1C6|nr:TetR/AcrR family transcriptional regulator [Sinomonas susongensis]
MPRADAQRNLDALLAAAKEEFAAHGVDVGVRAIAARAGVGTATLYRHFPLRSDLIAAVFRREIDDVTAEAARLAETHEPGEALELWAQRYTEFVATKHGLGAALRSGEPAYSGLREYFEGNAGPALRRLLDDAAQAGVIRDGVDPIELIGAIANLCAPAPGSSDTSRAPRMVRLLLDGLRYGALPTR